MSCQYCEFVVVAVDDSVRLLRSFSEAKKEFGAADHQPRFCHSTGRFIRSIRDLFTQLTDMYDKLQEIEAKYSCDNTP